MTRAVIIGGQGQIARSLVERLSARNIETISLARPHFDLADSASLVRAIIAAVPDIVINPAAYTAVDRAEDEAGLAMAVNRDGAAAVAEAAATAGVPVVHFSTDYVFDGAKDLPYVETDATGPLNVYGRSKLAGEIAVAAANPRHLILRTSWVCSPYGSNFVRTMLRLAGERREVRVVADQRGVPTFAADIAEAVATLAPGLCGAGEDDPRFGIYHLTSRGKTTWHGLAAAIFAEAARRGVPLAEAIPIATAEYPTKARRPASSRLSTMKFETTFGLQLPDWRASLGSCVEKLLNGSK